MTNYKDKYKSEISLKLQKDFSYKSPLEIPRIISVTLNSGVGRIKESDDEIAHVAGDLALISGQKPKYNKSAKSISGFKLREGQIVGLSVTLRGRRMYDFIERLVTVALPRIRDFRGLNKKSFSGSGNYSIGIFEHTIFPEIKFEKTKTPFGLQVNITTTAKSKDEAKKLLEYFGFPFVKENK